MFKPKAHNLHWPIQGKEKKITNVIIKPITMGELRAQNLLHKGKDEAALRSCIFLSTDISADSMGKMVAPDYTSIKNQVVEFLKLPASLFLEEIFEKKQVELNQQYQALTESEAETSALDAVSKELEKQTFNPSRPQLLIPITGDGDKQITSYKLKPPTVKMTELMDDYEDEWERTIFISANCSGLSEAQLNSLSVPDWNQLQGSLSDFLVKSADFYRPKTSKH